MISPSKHHPPCLGEHQTSIITHRVGLSVRLTDFVCIRFWREKKGFRGEWMQLSLYLLPASQTGDGDPAEDDPLGGILQCTHAMRQQNSSVRQNADKASHWPAKQRGIMLSHDTWDQCWQLQIWSCSTFHLLTDAVDYRQQIAFIKCFWLLRRVNRLWKQFKTAQKPCRHIQIHINKTFMKLWYFLTWRHCPFFACLWKFV